MDDTLFGSHLMRVLMPLCFFLLYYKTHAKSYIYSGIGTALILLLDFFKVSFGWNIKLSVILIISLVGFLIMFFGFAYINELKIYQEFQKTERKKAKEWLKLLILLCTVVLLIVTIGLILKFSIEKIVYLCLCVPILLVIISMPPYKTFLEKRNDFLYVLAKQEENDEIEQKYKNENADLIEKILANSNLRNANGGIVCPRCKSINKPEDLQEGIYCSSCGANLSDF